MARSISKLLVKTRCLIKGHDFIPSASRPGYRTCVRCGFREIDDTPAEIIINALSPRRPAEAPVEAKAESDAGEAR